MELRRQVQANIREHDLLADGSSVLLGISGGVDSMVLLHLLCGLAPENSWALAVCHFNHGLRGSESEADEEFVRATAARLRLPFHVGGADVRLAAKERGESIEMTGRDLRHQFLLETARRLNCSGIVLAHHADDNVETFWLRLLRGDTGRGLGGIRWKRPAAPGSEIQLVRPLLNIPKSILLTCARDQGIPFREDRSNADPGFLRNRLRLEILPTLEIFQPALREIALRTAEVLGTEKSYLEAEARRWLATRARRFEELHVALQREIVRVQLVSLGVRPSFELIEALRGAPNQAVSVSSTHRVYRKNTGDLLAEGSAAVAFNENAISVPLASSGQIVFDGVEFAWTTVASRGPSATGLEFFDADSLGGTITLRHWRPGDRFDPIGLGREAKLQDLLTNLKLSADEKRRLVLAVADDGKVFWVEGLRISERHKVTSGSRSILRWNWRRIS